MASLYEMRDLIKAFKNKKLEKFSNFLHEKTPISANFLSALGLISGLIAIYFLFKDNLYFSIFILLTLSFDILDGALAKAEMKKEDGWIVDRGIDRLITLLILFKSILYVNFPYTGLILLIFIAANIFLFYQRLILQKKLEMIYFDPTFQVLLIFQLYLIGLSLLGLAYFANLIFIIYKVRKSRPLKS